MKRVCWTNPRRGTSTKATTHRWARSSSSSAGKTSRRVSFKGVVAGTSGGYYGTGHGICRLPAAPDFPANICGCPRRAVVTDDGNNNQINVAVVYSRSQAADYQQQSRTRTEQLIEQQAGWLQWLHVRSGARNGPAELPPVAAASTRSRAAGRLICPSLLAQCKK